MDIQLSKKYNARAVAEAACRCSALCGSGFYEARSVRTHRAARVFACEVCRHVVPLVGA